MRRLALIAVALAACVASVPSMAAPPSFAFRVSAQSDELRPTIVATAATTASDEANAVLDSRAAHPIVAPTYWAQLNYVGRNPYVPGRITIAGRYRSDYS